ncbi:hypothetical protein NEOLI_000529 [Neolecta irregularis DAH-3]|uniref:Uncharacterized protein n=1 Tax=Neolecta irregularis (strain DAH-3) TaxID=1198029 RepID=A0A1U7LS74_NEOID|nr:hypothetical protein NEOLI_000529 [Neolecta irregularis DAH-3]|eukprot:OLL25433.1 hypothetical protein NEOLI_000529 [Neolecta irregularis DAH-3]
MKTEPVYVERRVTDSSLQAKQDLGGVLCLGARNELSYLSRKMGDRVKKCLKSESKNVADKFYGDNYKTPRDLALLTSQTKFMFIPVLMVAGVFVSAMPVEQHHRAYHLPIQLDGNPQAFFHKPSERDSPSFNLQKRNQPQGFSKDNFGKASALNNPTPNRMKERYNMFF